MDRPKWDNAALAAEHRQQDTVAEDAPRARQVNDYVHKREQRSAIQHARGALKRAEARVEEQERLLSACQQKLSSPEIATDYNAAMRVAEEAARLEAELESLYADWQEADQALQALCCGAEQEET